MAVPTPAIEQENVGAKQVKASAAERSCGMAKRIATNGMRSAGRRDFGGET